MGYVPSVVAIPTAPMDGISEGAEGAEEQVEDVVLVVMAVK